MWLRFEDDGESESECGNVDTKTYCQSNDADAITDFKADSDAYG